MKSKACLLISVLFLGASNWCFSNAASKVRASTVQSDNGPKILNASVRGKKLIVTGENFGDDALILVDGQPQKTTNDSDYPRTMLIAKKAGKHIPENVAVGIQVQSLGSLSDKFPFFKGLILVFEDAGKAINLKVGDRFLLSLQRCDYRWVPDVDGKFLIKVGDVEGIPRTQGVFEALSAGRTQLNAIAERDSNEALGACISPTLLVTFDLIIEQVE